jgi:hypothetical protein
MADPRICSVENCCKPVKVKSRGLCNSHYIRFQRHGSPLGGATAKNAAIAWLRLHATHEGEECLIWPYAKSAEGYGVCYDPARKAVRTVSDFMCELAHGPKPTGLHESCHSCGNGSGGCANPIHLRWGTHADNEGDKVAHGTDNAGSRHGCSKLSEDDVLAIKDSAKTLSGVSAAKLYGVSKATVSMIRSGKTWRHV